VGPGFLVLPHHVDPHCAFEFAVGAVQGVGCRQEKVDCGEDEGVPDHRGVGRRFFPQLLGFWAFSSNG
jgi:hypothetical protein